MKEHLITFSKGLAVIEVLASVVTILVLLANFLENHLWYLAIPSEVIIIYMVGLLLEDSFWGDR